MRAALFLLSFLWQSVAAQRVSVAPVPTWVKEVPVQTDEALGRRDMEDGYVHFLSEREIDIGTQTTYRRNVLGLETETGVQNASQVSVSYDPSYEQLTFHYIHILRGSKVIDALKPARFKIIHQEKDIYKSIYNGTLTAVLFLEDVRKGDRIDYAYSLKGNNPVFGDKFSETLDGGFSVPVAHLYYSVRCPVGRTLHILKTGDLPDPKVGQEGNCKVFEWNINEVAAIEEDDDAPSWFDPYPHIAVSEYKDWREVNDWALSLFQTNPSPSGALGEEIRHIRERCKTPEEKVLSALRFVQDEVRYLGIEIGPNTHQPHNAGQVFAQRFGDCKDKTLLLCTMLRALDIEASPVLINTDDRDKLLEELPSPDDFDHATVRVSLNGKYYWLDPTISLQRGRLEDLSFPDYGYGLVLGDTTTTLSLIPVQDNGAVTAHESFQVDSLSGPIHLDIITRYTGSYADEIRSEFNNSSRDEIQKSYLKFYQDSYDEIKVRDSLGVSDDDTTGTFITQEYYTIGKLWDKETGKASFDAALIRSILPKLKDKARTAPFVLAYPQRYKEELEIRLPEAWALTSTDKEIKAPGFVFRSSVRSSGKTVRLTYAFETLQDHVAAGDNKTAYRRLDDVKDELGYGLSAEQAVSSSPVPEQDVLPHNPHDELNLWEGIILTILIGWVVVFHIRRWKR
jgi:transglutaminase-like putative cysteine protease